MGKQHIEVKDGFIAVYPSLDEAPGGCRIWDLVAGVLRSLRREKEVLSLLSIP